MAKAAACSGMVGWPWANVDEPPRSILTRQIDARTAEQLAREIETARRHVREGEERIARQQVLMEKTESARYLGDTAQGTKLLNSMRFTLDLARHHLQRLESGGWIRNATASESRAGPPWGAPVSARRFGRAPPRLKP